MVKGLEPQGKGKLVRATPAIIKCEAGQVYLPESAPWLEEFVAELVQFTGIEGQDAADDQVDAFSYAVQSMNQFTPFERPVVIDNPPRRDPLAGRSGDGQSPFQRLQDRMRRSRR